MKKDNKITYVGRNKRTEIEQKMHEQFIKRLDFLVSENGKNPTYYQVAQAIGVDKGVVQKWYNGTMPSAKYLRLLATTYKCSIDYLLGFDDFRHSGNKEIMGITGLSEQAIETLRVANLLPDDDFDYVCKENKKMIACLNKLLQAGLTARRGGDSWPETSVLSLIYDYVYGSAGINEQQMFNVSDNHGVQTEVKAKDIYKQMRLNEINDFLIQLCRLDSRQQV